MVGIQRSPQTWLERIGFANAGPFPWLLLAIFLLAIIILILWIRERRYFAQRQRENRHRGFQVIASYRDRSS